MLQLPSGPQGSALNLPTLFQQKSGGTSYVKSNQKPKANPSLFIHHSRGPSIEKVSLNPVHETDFHAEERDKSEEKSHNSEISQESKDKLAKIVDRVLE